MSDPGRFADGDLVEGIAAISKFIDRGPNQTLKLLQSGELLAFRVGAHGNWRMRKSAFAAYVVAQEQRGSGRAA